MNALTLSKLCNTSGYDFGDKLLLHRDKSIWKYLEQHTFFVVASTGIVTRTTILLIVDPYSQGGKDLKLAWCYIMFHR